jgi:hypothetical protein
MKSIGTVFLIFSIILMCRFENVAMQSSSCGSLGYPSPSQDSAGCCRLYTKYDCVALLRGAWYESGECLKLGGGSWSYDCRGLNSQSSPSPSPSSSPAAPSSSPASPSPSSSSSPTYQMCGDCICPQSLFTCVSTAEISASGGVSYKGAGITGSGSNAKGATIKFCCDQTTAYNIAACKTAGSCKSDLTSASAAGGRPFLFVIGPFLIAAAAHLLSCP